MPEKNIEKKKGSLLIRKGDRVRVMETRPQSATKRWRLVEILEKAK